MEKIGIDSAIAIYLLEDKGTRGEKSARLFRQIERGEKEGALSVIGIIEILTGPKKLGRYELVAEYRTLFSHFPHLTIFGISERAVEVSSDLRARYGIATPDAIHIATAIDFGAQRFITNDKKLRRVKEINVEIL